MLRSVSQEVDDQPEEQQQQYQPPPPPPPTRPTSSSSSASSIPTPTTRQALTLSGTALTRHGALSLFTHTSWHPCFWVLKKDKLQIFDTHAEYEQGTPPKKAIPLVERMSVGELKYKHYSGKHGGNLHYFAIEELVDGRKSVVIKFASLEREEMEAMQSAIAASLEEEIRRRIEYSVKVLKDPSQRQKVIDTVIMKERTRSSSGSVDGNGKASSSLPALLGGLSIGGGGGAGAGAGQGGASSPVSAAGEDNLVAAVQGDAV